MTDFSRDELERMNKILHDATIELDERKAKAWMWGVAFSALLFDEVDLWSAFVILCVVSFTIGFGSSVWAGIQNGRRNR